MSAYLFTRRVTASRLSAVPRLVGDDSVLVQTLGAVLGVGALLPWLGGVPVPVLLPWLVGLIVPTIGGERLELARIAMGRTQDGSWYSSPVAWWSAWSPNCCGHKPGGGVDVPLLDHADVRPYRQRAPRGSRDRTTRPSPMDRSYLLVQTELYLGPQGEPVDMEKLQAERTGRRGLQRVREPVRPPAAASTITLRHEGVAPICGKRELHEATPGPGRAPRSGSHHRRT